jgi:two-component system chemotaxis sensor kinase CheA
VVRDLARELGRQVRLELSGQHTEIDKYIVERIADPLLHLVRNAVGHGLESAAERVAGGKPPEGLIMLSATTVGDAVTVELADDGRGVDVAAVAASARARGLPVPEGPLDDAQLLEILCAPGFSTREAADRISGRGVGMDVVWQTVHELGGTLSLTTAVGSGTRFRLQLPLTLTIVDALVVVAGGERFAIPLPAVAEAIAFGAADITVLERNELLRYRDDVLPLLRLSRVFGLPSAVAGGYALILRHGGQTLAVAVDRLREKREIVVRAIRDPLLSVVGVGGATELGDGRVVLILDPPGLAQLARKTSLRAARGQIAPDGRTHVMAAPPVATDSYILFELAGATYGIRSADVLHIDMVEHVTPVPNASPAVDGVVLVRGQLVPLLNLRTRFGFPRQPHDLRTRVIVIQHGARQVGLLVDAAREFVRIAADAFRPPPAAIAELSGDYLAAIATLGERLVLLLKLDEVLTLTDGLEPPVQPTQT